MGKSSFSLGVGLGCLRGILVATTAALLALGVAAIVIGAISARSSTLSSVLHLPAIYIALLVFGSIVTILAFVGLYGSVALSRPSLAIFFTLLLIITVAELGVGMATYILGDQETIRDSIKSNWSGTKAKYRIEIQNRFVCCGLSGSSSIDAPCPPLGIGKGCLAPFTIWMQYRLQVFGSISIISAVLQVIILIFSLTLFKTARHANDEEHQNLLSLMEQRTY